jgi:hypothetical protein
MYNFWFELKHALSLWRSYSVYLLLLPLLLAATLVMLHAGLILQQRPMAPMPVASANTASGFWSLGLQDDSFQTSAFNPRQLRQLTTELQPDYQMATLNSGVINSGVRILVSGLALCPCGYFVASP